MAFLGIFELKQLKNVTEQFYMRIRFQRQKICKSHLLRWLLFCL